MIRSNRFLRIAMAGIALVFIGLRMAPHPVHAQQMHQHAAEEGSVTLGALSISGAFTRATLPNAPVGGGYLTIINSAAEPDRLISATADVSAKVQLHQMAVVDGMMKMSELPEGIEIPAGGTVKLVPGGLHIMFLGLNRPFVAGEGVPVTLTFEKAGVVTVELAVGSVGASAPSGHGH